MSARNQNTDPNNFYDELEAIAAITMLLGYERLQQKRTNLVY